jgi:hypothetical protein
MDGEAVVLGPDGVPASTRWPAATLYAFDLVEHGKDLRVSRSQGHVGSNCCAPPRRAS